MDCSYILNLFHNLWLGSQRIKGKQYYKRRLYHLFSLCLWLYIISKEETWPRLFSIEAGCLLYYSYDLQMIPDWLIISLCFLLWSCAQLMTRQVAFVFQIQPFRSFFKGKVYNLLGPLDLLLVFTSLSRCELLYILELSQWIYKSTSSTNVNTPNFSKQAFAGWDICRLHCFQSQGHCRDIKYLNNSEVGVTLCPRGSGKSSQRRWTWSGSKKSISILIGREEDIFNMDDRAL